MPAEDSRGQRVSKNKRTMCRQVSPFVRYPGGSHLFILTGRPAHRVDFNQRTADWVTSHTR